MNDFSPFVSVIVPVYNHAEHLKLCLAALARQTYPKNCYEVIVIDNGSDDAENIKKIVNQFTQTCFTSESTPGSYAARNQGLSIAKGEIIAFTDADCIPNHNWLEKGVENLQKVPNCGLVAGKIELFFQNMVQPTPVELYESITAFPQEKLLAEKHGGATANIFTFKKVFDRVGKFNNTLKSNGDLEWGYRVYQQGYPQIYAEDVRVLHPARTSWKQLYFRSIRLAAGSYDRQLQQTSSKLQKQLIFLINLSKNLVPPVMFIINSWRNTQLSGFNQKLQVCLAMFFVRYVTALEIIKLQLGSVSARI
ncbi:glycosyltransferase [Oscillatoria salina]|uniref:glycosyltransferase n=1 Tax=Oscillatoria salina TaxID=331517 RepID=UPI0013B9251B|nr:glycosyltransferase [Oscillatoria salina]MBZ8180606.1 glycosyltransferase [Oscillatoria salina IIICB1]NET88451.1 glycosyltransferase [Kamptonema sp. SIO1D9]